MSELRFASRLNSFKAGAREYWPAKNGKVNALDLIERAASVPGLNAVDFNYPDHLEGVTPKEIAAKLKECGVELNGFAMRYYSDPAFKRGAFTNADPAVRRKAIDLTKSAIDAMREAGGDVLTIWPGQDGFDYSFHADHSKLWDLEIQALQEVADHDKGVEISLEYKPNEPRAFSLLPDAATTLLAIKDTGRPNFGVTLDLCHVFYADEMPAFAAGLVAKHSKILGIHINDCNGKRDDGLMVGSVHLIQTIELLYVLDRIGYDGMLYFDTFPDIYGIDPAAECASNIETVKGMRKIVDKLRGNKALDEAIAKQDAVASQRILHQALFNL